MTFVMKRNLAAYLLGFTCIVFPSRASAAPTILVWSGQNQTFGQIGNPQAAINILGNVSDPSGVAALSYRLNGGSQITLSIGPDGRRLVSPGDFNVDINTSSLSYSNTVEITARNNLNETTTTTVYVTYVSGQVWPLPYSVNWSGVGSIESVAQTVDGRWAASNGTVRTMYVGYDRLLAIGDRTWTDYEVTVPITMHSLDSSGFNNISQTPGVGLLFRWTGHTDNPISGWQPKSGYLPLGAIGWYRWDYGDNGMARLELVGNNLNTIQADFSGSTLSFNVTYMFKMRVETIQGQGSLYKFKVWNAGQGEPASWNLQGMQTLSDPLAGSVCLLTHHIDADFGNVTITAIPDPVPVQLSSFTATNQNTSVRLDWTTTSETNNYGFEVQKSAGQEFLTQPNSFVPGHGTSLEPHHYYFIDSSLTAGSWRYRLKQTDLDGTVHFTEPVQVSILTTVGPAAKAATFSLDQNYPNPFNPSTNIDYEIPAQSWVTLEVFNVMGQHVSTLVDGEQPAGSYSQRFDAGRLTSGIYFYRLTAAGHTVTRKMMLMR